MLVPYLILYWLIKPRHQGKKRSFRQRLQTVVFITLGLSFLAIGPVSVIYMRSLYNQKTSASQFETTRSIAAEMGHDIDIEELINQVSRETVREVLHHYATTFFTDLNLYKLDGRMLATTRTEIFDLNLQAPLMNAEAYQAMHQNKALYYTHEEHLGKGTYESAYIPLNDGNGNAIAYLNTPYFTSATELHTEIQNFVLTYINIILVLLAIALIFVINLTNRLTQPLSLIQNKLGNIRIDQKNEPIEWKAKDEIGALVKQYNLLIVELEKSTAELKRTTTESAWRGVARQVAHEIKNSLTPMRLSVQMLQRNIENGKATPEQTQRTANTLIEQIDALSDIASSFSRYAKLPENHPAPLDLAELVGNVVNLYDNEENIEFAYHYDQTQNHTFNGDKTNLNSAVGNLVKNAVQAIGNKPDGKIEVSLQSTETSFIISVKDNGKGIKDEDKDRIFLPNFTTKSGGSGVGLSLTYNIVQAAGGTISFESQENVGTRFQIELPKQNKPNP
jgi:signal transduction histidine kinase